MVKTATIMSLDALLLLLMVCAACWAAPLKGSSGSFGERNVLLNDGASEAGGRKQKRVPRIIFLNAGGLSSSKLVPWLAERVAPSTEIIAMVELQGYSSEALKSMGKALQFDYSRLMEVPSGFHIGLLSKFHLKNIVKHVDGFERGVLEATARLASGLSYNHAGTTLGIRILVAHLNAHSDAAHRTEAAALAKIAQDAIADGDGVLVVGDLNFLSPTDNQKYVDEELVKSLSDNHEDILEKKYLLPTSGKIDYKPAWTLTDAGLMDLCADQGGVLDRCWGTEPTLVKYDQVRGDETLRTRVLYALAGADFLNKFCKSFGQDQDHDRADRHRTVKVRKQVYASAIRDQATGALFDHYPIYVGCRDTEFFD